MGAISLVMIMIIRLVALFDSANETMFKRDCIWLDFTSGNQANENEWVLSFHTY
jgi:hypothetical protein